MSPAIHFVGATSGMRSWLKALVVLAALMVGLPGIAWAHTSHGHGQQAVVFDVAHNPQNGPTEASVAGGSVVVVATSLRTSDEGGGGALLPCCCQGTTTSCAPSHGGAPFGDQAATAWDLASLARLSRLIRSPTDRLDYAAPLHRLDRPPKV